MKITKISWEDSAMLRNGAGDLLDGVVITIHGMIFEVSVCRHVEGLDPDIGFHVVDILHVEDYTGPESQEAMLDRRWEAAVCFTNEYDAAQWVAQNVQKRLLMTDLHEKDWEVFKALPDVSYEESLPG